MDVGRRRGEGTRLRRVGDGGSGGVGGWVSMRVSAGGGGSLGGGEVCSFAW